jgi:hypothetical protein
MYQLKQQEPHTYPQGRCWEMSHVEIEAGARKSFRAEVESRYKLTLTALAEVRGS